MKSTRESKLNGMNDALDLIVDGTHLALGGMMLYRRPVRACRALAGRGVEGLTVTTFAAGIEVELLVERSCVSTLRTCYSGLEYLGPAPLIRNGVESDSFSFIDETEMTLAAGLAAATMKLPWMPVGDALASTDYESIRSDIARTVASDGTTVVLAPALAPDVFIAHVPFADIFGNALVYGSMVLDRDFASASKYVILTADEIVPTDDLVARGMLDFLSFQVDMVVDAPKGAVPTSCLPHYDCDVVQLLDHIQGSA